MKNRMFIASLLAAATVTVAQADHVNYDFTYFNANTGVGASGSLVMAGFIAQSGSVTVYGAGGMNGVYSLVFGNGSGTGQYSASGAFIFDNLMDCDVDPALDGYGLLFSNGAGMEINIWGNGPGNYSLYGWDPAIGYGPQDNGGIFECHKVPAPGALALLGCAGMLGSRRRRA